ncbi:hypothetical protein CC80DRAFT_175691 [Byssothecium circinans]|uniref:Uncharacterized protein n=1 Tax=Byssothecium circinans TaxID=147558 RepID=A0A6A5TJF1_9PLEO|nr:hypothetical protein CC80DRAFT_175691 [Byssothecium circinans]
MNSSTRLYERLGQIPQDPGDPESIDDLIVCAFGAFERYYVCWKNKAGEYKQDGYDLPPELSEWLWPTDGTTRDFPSLQVVFGRGDEYFASDKDGKLEFKEPEKKAPPPEELDAKSSLKRTRTMSVFQSSSDASATLFNSSLDDSSSRRSSGASQAAARPPSVLFSARSLTDTSLNSNQTSRSPSISSLRSTTDSTFTAQSPSRPTSAATTVPSRPTSDADVKPIDITTEPTPEEPKLESPITPMRFTRRSPPLSMSFKPSSFHRIPENKALPKLPPPEPTPTKPTPSLPISVSPPLPSTTRRTPSPPIQTTTSRSPQRPAPETCTCGCHAEPLPLPQPQSRPSYADASIQTDPLPSPPRTALRLDTTPSVAAIPGYSYTDSAHDTETSFDDYYYRDAPAVNPFPMGSMSAFFSKPGYQLGDGLAGGEFYEYGYGEEYGGYGGGYEEDDDDGIAAWEAANGKG